jgi:glutamine amidotransferase
MSKKIIIIDYQLGNLYSVNQVFKHLGHETFVTNNKEDILNADYLVLPGVGAFGDAMNRLNEFDLVDPIKEYANSGKPLMGICLGLQLLLTESNEFGISKGLNIIKGTVEKFEVHQENQELFKVPQIQWNMIHEAKKWKGTPLNDCTSDSFMYFVHSYFVNPIEKDVVLSTTNYGAYNYCSSLIKNNIFATQFHPEKSGKDGIKIYQNWLNQ